VIRLRVLKPYTVREAIIQESPGQSSRMGASREVSYFASYYPTEVRHGAYELAAVFTMQ
jgi:hypothetical protein